MIYVGVTGHRPERIQGKQEEIQKWINKCIKDLTQKYGEWTLINGVARGVDQMFALEAIKQGVPVISYFPYRHKLSPIEEFIAEKSAEVRYQRETFQDGCYFDRDRRIVNKSNFMLVVWDGDNQGGTYFTMLYAVNHGKKCIFFPGTID